ncbi:MAG: helix-turn-helix domain-containing protein [Bacteroidales bacterium]|nr:AraC family transcriptional regulator [Bacteroidales bacterium]MDD6751324.1 helix-turn-helix domain-containing protein [Bacteroidales bacterium]MDY2877816.1 helix-turn-helix domain-containing protein [Candidatus Cryptobacteroides sp.]
MSGLLKKRSCFDSASTERIGNDVILLSEGEFWTGDTSPYIADNTTAIFLLRGSLEMMINMHPCKASAPAMVILMEGMVVQQQSRSHDSRFNVIAISNEFSDRILSDANVSLQLRAVVRENPVFSIAGERETLLRFHSLLRRILAMDSNPYRLEAVKYLTLTLFCGFALGRDSKSDKELSHKEAIVESFLKLVRENYRTERSVSWYADKLCISPKYLSQVVKDTTGRPALDWIDEYAITESKALLNSTGLSIEQISVKMNFLSTALFGKYFKRITGMSPRQYRNAVK